MIERQAPTYNRQRLLLFLLEGAGGSLSKMDFQKLLFLVHQDSELAYYDFVPYHYGCYSFLAASDIETLELKGWIDTTDIQIRLKDKPYLGPGIKSDERQTVARLMRKYASLRGDTLLKTVYTRYPYYAIRSRIADRVVTDNTLAKIALQQASISKSESQLFTIGYEGQSLESYVNLLIQNNVKLLCDVRKNPLSRKFGFSKNTLAAILPKLGIEYSHMPELGIVSEKRQHLETQDDYEKLFAEYSRHLPEKEHHLLALKRRFDQFERVALTCYEAPHSSCHRSRISEYLQNRWQMKVTHL